MSTFTENVQVLASADTVASINHVRDAIEEVGKSIQTSESVAESDAVEAFMKIFIATKQLKYVLSNEKGAKWYHLSHGVDEVLGHIRGSRQVMRATDLEVIETRKRVRKLIDGTDLSTILTAATDSCSWLHTAVEGLSDALANAAPGPLQPTPHVVHLIQTAFLEANSADRVWLPALGFVAIKIGSAMDPDGTIAESRNVHVAPLSAVFEHLSKYESAPPRAASSAVGS